MKEYYNSLVEHKRLVSKTIFKMIEDLEERSEKHDLSKFSNDEFPIFEKEFSTLKKTSFGSQEYKDSLARLGDALQHHYKNNRHHPEFFENGINDMNLFDIFEMLADWIAAIKKHNDGDIYKSLEINKDRFNMSDQLYDILKNTVNSIVNE